MGRLAIEGDKLKTIQKRRPAMLGEIENGEDRIKVIETLIAKAQAEKTKLRDQNLSYRMAIEKSKVRLETLSGRIKTLSEGRALAEAELKSLAATIKTKTKEAKVLRWN